MSQIHCLIPSFSASVAISDPECSSSILNVAWTVVTRLMSSSSSTLDFIRLPWPTASSMSSASLSAFRFSHVGSVALDLLGLGAVAASSDADVDFRFCPTGSADLAFALL